MSFIDSTSTTPVRPTSKSRKRQINRKAHKIQYKVNTDSFIKNLSNITLTDHYSKSRKRSLKRKTHKIQYKANNDSFIKNLSNITLTDHDLALLNNGLKYIPTPSKPASHESLINDFHNFTRTMRLKYLFANSESKPHPFHVNSKWQPPPQPSVALENYLERTKFEIATTVFSDARDNLSAKQRQTLSALRANKRVNIMKADKGTTTVVMDTYDKIKEGNQQLLDQKFYIPLTEPIVSLTATKAKTIVNTLFTNGHIDSMTYKWLNQGQNPPSIPEFYTLTKIHKPSPVGRPIVSGSGGPTERILSFVDSLLRPIAQKQESYIKNTTHFVNFIENTKLPDKAVLATLDVCSLYTNIPQEEGINVICHYYDEHYQSEAPIPTQTLGDLMRLILKENSFQFNGEHFLQTHGIAMGTKMAVAFAVIFMAHIEKQLLASSPHKPIIWKRFIDDIFFSVDHKRKRNQ